MTTVLHNIKTPYYLIDEEILKTNCETILRVKQDTGCKILLATKAFACFDTFPLISTYLDGTTNSSVNEARLSAETFGKDVHVYSPAFTQSDIDQLKNIADHVVFNSLSQLQQYSSQLSSTTQIGLRINPEHVEVKNPLYSPCVPGSRFGVRAKDLAIAQCEAINGFHIHALCQNDGESLVRLIKATEKTFKNFLMLDHIKWVNFGGGHMIAAPNYNRDLIVDVINEFQNTYNVQVILEPGEAVVSKAGTLVSTVLDIVHNNLDIAILDTSATAHMPDVIEMPYRPTILSSAPSGIKPYTYRLAGNTCLSGDIIGEYSFDAPLVPGNQIVFEDMAQYTIVKNTLFNGLQLPSIVIKPLNKKPLITKVFNYNSFKDRLGY